MPTRPDSRYQYEPRAQRYRERSSGRFVPAETVRAELDRVLQASSDAMRGLTEQLRDGRLTIAQWQRGMASLAKEAHLVGAAAAKGGWANMAPSDYGMVGARLKEQYAFLKGFAEQVASGQQRLDGTANARADLYGEAGRATHREMQRRMGRQAGQDEERRVLGPADHCGGCLSEASKGWRPIGSLLPIGAAECRTRCRCSWQTRRSRDAGAASVAA